MGDGDHPPVAGADVAEEVALAGAEILGHDVIVGTRPCGGLAND
jgi:hypothetical protein